MKKTLLIASVATGIGLAGIGGAGIAAAATPTSASGEQSLTQRIAERFNLDPAEVTAAAEEQRDERQAVRSAERSDYLQQLVDSGEITAEQKAAIEEKAVELQQKFEAERKDLQAWADEQGLDLRELRGLMRDGGFGLGQHR